MPSRRRFLRAATAAAGAWALDAGSVARLLAHSQCQAVPPEGELLEILPLGGASPRPTVYGEKLGGPGLERRRFTDLSTLAPESLITPSEKVFLRTEAPRGVAERASDWTVALGPGGRAGRLSIADLRRQAIPMGTHLLECAGNADPNNFGLLSVAEWTGVPLADLVARQSPPPEAWGVLVAGEDHERSARASLPGASWILPLADLPALGAFLATGMNGDPLPLDHGAPVRLVVPGWYACAWIKWVREIGLVDAEALVTWQMAEYVGRTHQPGYPLLARDYEAPAIDLAAMPIRVERRRVRDRIEHHVIGIAWGGSAPVDRLEIRFGARDPWQAVELCQPTNPHAWSLWSCKWTPAASGTYTITLRCPDPAVRTRRLDMYFYARQVRVAAL
jgi:DMSO/TMAO reductase YedYZ molybdopterin-dependent catalytic subunit